MRLYPPSSLGRRLCLFALLLACVSSSALLAAEAAKKRFDLPADTAENSLKQLAAQSGREVLFIADSVKNMRTQAVKGEMEPRAALESMLAGTTLIGVEDASTGAITIRRVAFLPPKASATPAASSSRCIRPTPRF